MRLYKFKSFQNPEHVLDIIQNQRLYCAPYYKLNDPMEGRFLRKDYFGKDSIFNPYDAPMEMDVDMLIDPENYFDVRVCCLSDSFSSIPMWTYYTESHKGCVFEIDFTGKERDLKKVNYVPKLPVFNEPGYAGPSIDEILTNKLNGWAHESEYRIIGTDEYYDIQGRITKIILGSYMNVEIREQLARKAMVPVYTSTIDSVRGIVCLSSQYRTQAR